MLDKTHEKKIAKRNQTGEIIKQTVVRSLSVGSFLSFFSPLLELPPVLAFEFVDKFRRCSQCWWHSLLACPPEIFFKQIISIDEVSELMSGKLPFLRHCRHRNGDGFRRVLCRCHLCVLGRSGRGSRRRRCVVHPSRFRPRGSCRLRRRPGRYRRVVSHRHDRVRNIRERDRGPGRVLAFRRVGHRELRGT